MFCKNCGHEVQEGQRFCMQCGASLIDNSTPVDNTSIANENRASEPQIAAAQVNKPQDIQPESAPTPKSSSGKIVIGIVAVAVIAALIAVGIFVIKGGVSTSIDMNKYVQVKFEGYESMGKASVSFDEDAFVKDYKGKLKIDKKSYLKLVQREAGIEDGNEVLFQAAYGDYIDSYLNENPPEVIFAEGFMEDMKLDKTNRLKNGDTVTFSWNMDAEEAQTVEEIFKCRLKYEDIEYIVDGLKEVGSFDPFEYVDVSFTGAVPDGTVTISKMNDIDEMKYIDFKADKNKGLTNGDTVVVKAYIGINEDEFVEKFGRIPGVTEKSYTVDGLSFYITRMEDIPAEAYDKMDKKLYDAFYAHVAEYWEQEPLSFELIGNYLLIAKEDAYVTANNRLFFIYKVAINSEDSDSDFVYYWFGYFDDIMIQNDGTCDVDHNNYTVCESSIVRAFLSNVKKGDFLQVDKRHFVAGFPDTGSLYNKHIKPKSGDYDITSTINE